MLNIFLKTNIFKHKDVLFVHFGKNLRMLKKKIGLHLHGILLLQHLFYDMRSDPS